MLLREERELVAEYGRKMSADRLSTGTSGNLSVYDPQRGLMVISPSGMGYFDIQPEDVVVTDLNAQVVEGERKPSSEWALHTAFYRQKPQARAVVHTHSMYCTTFAALGLPLRAVHYAIADAGVSEVTCALYKTFGTQEVARVPWRLGAGSAVLLATTAGGVRRWNAKCIQPCCNMGLWRSFSTGDVRRQTQYLGQGQMAVSGEVSNLRSAQ